MPLLFLRHRDLFTLDDIQLEVVPSAASVASGFVRESFSSQLLKAQRFYAKTFAYGTAPAQSVTIFNNSPLYVKAFVTTVSPSQRWQFPVQMRSNPTITTFNPAANNANCRNVTASADSTISVEPENAVGTTGTVITCSAGAAAGGAIYVHAQADAGI